MHGAAVKRVQQHPMLNLALLRGVVAVWYGMVA